MKSNKGRKRCKVCRKLFDPYNSLETVCSPKCAIAFIKTGQGKKFVEKARRAETREIKKKLKTKSDLANEAQQAFNAFIRERDRLEPCISCGRYHQGQYHAGHYRSVGAAPELRFNEFNVHKQCMPCNTHKSGNAIEYRINLIKKIGVDKVESLEGPHEIPHWTREELIDIKKKYVEKLKQLKRLHC